MSLKKHNIQYVGKIPCKIANTAIGEVTPNQTLYLPRGMVDNLVLDKNWKLIDETPPGPKKEKEKKEKGGK